MGSQLEANCTPKDCLEAYYYGCTIESQLGISVLCVENANASFCLGLVAIWTPQQSVKRRHCGVTLESQLNASKALGTSPVWVHSRKLDIPVSCREEAIVSSLFVCLRELACRGTYVLGLFRLNSGAKWNMPRMDFMRWPHGPFSSGPSFR